MGVGHLDAEEPRRPVVREPQCEVASGDAAVEDRVGGEFGHDEGDGVGHGAAVGQVPQVEAVRGESAGETGAPPRRGEPLGEHAYGDGLLGP